jgi:hypothetical protein
MWWPSVHLWSYLAEFFSEWEMFQTKAVQKIKTHFVFSDFFPENSAVCEIMWEKMVQPDRPHMTIWRMRIACWVPKATNTHSEHVILIAFPPQQWLHEHPSMLRYMYSTLPVWYGKVRSWPVLMYVSLQYHFTSSPRLSTQPPTPFQFLQLKYKYSCQCVVSFKQRLYYSTAFYPISYFELQSLQYSGNYMYQLFYVKVNYIMPAECMIYVSYVRCNWRRFYC